MSRTNQTVDPECGTTGLRLRGKVIRRSRKTVGTKNAEVVSYGILADGYVFDVDQWDAAACFDIGAQIDEAVQVRCFSTKNGTAMWRLVIDRGGKGAF